MNELRIGNIVMETIYDFDPKQIVINREHFSQPEYYYEPIPLTEEWLIRFGFETQMAWTYRIHLSGNNYLVYYLGEKGWSINNKNHSDFSCQYVHQLQNIFYAITQTELTLSNP